METNETMMLQILRDLALIKRRLSINDPGLDLDQDPDHDPDQELDLFKKDCEQMDLDLSGLDLGLLTRSIKYYLANKWRIKNPKGYIGSFLNKARSGSGSGKSAPPNTTLGYSDEELELYLPIYTEDLQKSVFLASPETAKKYKDYESIWQISDKRFILAVAKKKGLIK